MEYCQPSSSCSEELSGCSTDMHCISQKSATMQLLKWIRVSDELVGQLEKSGWHPGKKYLTPRQKDYIVGHLGEP